MPTPRSGRIVVSLGDECLEKLGWLAGHRDRSRSWIVRKLILAEYEEASRRAGKEPPRPVKSRVGRLPTEDPDAEPAVIGDGFGPENDPSYPGRGQTA